jgi:hypothetical protein
MDNSFTFTDYLLIFFYYMQRELECCDLMAEKFRTLRYGRADPGNPDCKCDGICNNPGPHHHHQPHRVHLPGVGGVKIDPIIKIKKGCGIFVFFQDDDAKTTGTPSMRSPLTAVVATIESKVLADADMTATMGGDPVTGTEHETFFLIINDR